MEYKKPDPIPYGPIPQVSINQQVEQQLSNQQQKISFLQKALEVNLFLSVLACGVIILLGIWLVFLKADINSSSPKNINSNLNIPLQSVLASNQDQEKDESDIFINEQGLDINKVFQTSENKVKLTIKGQLKKEVFGFLTYWSIPREEEINIDLLTSVSYFGLEVDDKGEIIKTDASGKPFVPWAEFNGPKFNDFVSRAKKNKTRIYVTLKCFDQSNIQKLVTSKEGRNNFIQNAVSLMNSKSLDGINIDFEYIGTPSDDIRDGFSLMMTQLNKELKNSYPQAILTIDTFVDAATNKRIHDIALLAQNSDGLVIMGYDFKTPRSSTTGSISPMDGYGLSIKNLMNSYLEKAPPEKLILAVPYYGYDWPVTQINKNAPVSGNSQGARVLSYAEIMDLSKSRPINWDESAQTPWLNYTDPQDKANRIIHFENQRSLGVKYDYINDKNLQGLGIWALGFDGKREELIQLIDDKFSY